MNIKLNGKILIKLCRGSFRNFGKFVRLKYKCTNKSKKTNKT